jgi:predicted nucleic acid-binding protein
LIVLDTSVVVAAFASWHEHHVAALKVLDLGPRLPAQAALETYSVLTRLPPPHRAAPRVVTDYLAANFAEPLLALSAEATADLLPELARADIVGGATYDALIGAIARSRDATLITFDDRAALTYRRLGVTVDYMR